jgi:3'-phosphoadenosine 5'-phosphosulfate sulfotransferase (PAPS reductase)/FAD synthetase
VALALLDSPAVAEPSPVVVARALQPFNSNGGIHHDEVAVTPEVLTALRSSCCSALGVSGGKDGTAMAIRVARYLDEIGHTGPRVLVHSDLGRVEWKDSLPACERLAKHIGWELMVVRRQAGDMLARWEGRWANNVARYRDLSCVKLILPWSTPSMRFCTSELKADVISSALKKRFKGLQIVSASGIRRAESASRAKMPVSKVDAKLSQKDLPGLTWNPIIDWSTQFVYDYIPANGLALHEAYTVYGASRVSCCFCIMSAQGDLRAAAGCADNHDVYRLMVDLEINSGYAFQGASWLGDVAPNLLGDERVQRLTDAKHKAVERNRIEARIPQHLLYTAGWPTCLPNDDEAELIASVRRDVEALYGFGSKCLTAETVQTRYQELWDEKTTKEAVAV